MKKEIKDFNATDRERLLTQTWTKHFLLESGNKCLLHVAVVAHASGCAIVAKAKVV